MRPQPARAQLYLAVPDGSVARTELSMHDGRVQLPLDVAHGDGRYRVELVTDRGGDPEVAAIWPFRVGAERAPPCPEVLFPDEGHSDLGLSHRAEALVQRLRNEQLLDPLKVAPTLVTLATERAAALARRGGLGHRLPDGRNAREALTASAPTFVVARLVEVQAQASTLADAWGALLDSPAHRYELVSPSLTHFGTAVARGADGAGRPLITVVALLARRTPKRDVQQTRAQLQARMNEARDERGLGPLSMSSALELLAQRLADRMADVGDVDEGLLGSPIAQLAVEDDASLTEVRSTVARLDDPLLLAMPKPALELDMNALGLGVAVRPTEGAFYVCVLVGEGAAR